MKRLKVLVAKPGLDGHDRGAKTVAYALREAGFEVIYTGLHKTVDEIVKTAVEEDVNVIGLSVLSGAHLSIVDKLMRLLKEENIKKTVIVGGVIPEDDIPKLRELGVEEVFPTGSRYDDIVRFLKEKADVR